MYLRVAALLCGLAWFVACSSEGDAPLGGGGTGAPVGGGAGGGGGSGEGGTPTQGVLGLVTFTDHATAGDAGGPSSTVSARFLEGAYGDGGTEVGALTLPEGCTQTTATVGDSTCRRIDCDVDVSTEPTGTERSAGRISLGGVTGVEGIDPTDVGTYPLLTSVGAPYWQPLATLDVSAAGDVVPAFSASVVAVAPLQLAVPLVGGDGTYPLSRSVGFAFALVQTVQTLRLTLAFQVALDAGSRRVMYDCAAPGTSGQIAVPAELVSDLPDDARPQSGSFFGETANSVELGSSAAPTGRVLVTARRAVVTELEQTPVDFTRFVVIP